VIRDFLLTLSGHRLLSNLKKDSNGGNQFRLLIFFSNNSMIFMLEMFCRFAHADYSPGRSRHFSDHPRKTANGDNLRHQAAWICSPPFLSAAVDRRTKHAISYSRTYCFFVAIHSNGLEENPMRSLSALLFLLLPLWFVTPATADVSWPDGCEIATGKRGDITLTCMPDQWNGSLVVYAHGYVPPQLELALPEEELTVDYQGGETTVPAILMQQGFAFVTSSYSKNGYAVEQGGADLNALVASFKKDRC
jgi:hypothetical protein